MKTKSVQSINPFKSVIQTIYDIIKAHGGEIKVETKEDEARPAVQSNHPGGDNRAGRGTAFIIRLPF
jgi:signal transduction histidine kinase